MISACQASRFRTELGPAQPQLVLLIYRHFVRLIIMMANISAFCLFSLTKQVKNPKSKSLREFALIFVTPRTHKIKY